MAAEPDTPATARLEGGLRCRVMGPSGEAITDMARALGGEESGPTPGWLLRAALAACDASSVAMEAAREGVELTGLEVTVTSESDSRGLLGVDDSVPAGPLCVHTQIRLTASNADEDQLRLLAERAETRSPVRDAIAREVQMTAEIEIA